MEVIDNVNELLRKKGITGAEMSRDLGFSTGTYSQWNTKRKQPSLEKITKMAEYFKVTVEYLMGMDKKNKTDDPEIADLEEKFESIMRGLNQQELSELLEFAEVYAAGLKQKKKKSKR